MDIAEATEKAAPFVDELRQGGWRIRYADLYAPVTQDPDAKEKWLMVLGLDMAIPEESHTKLLILVKGAGWNLLIDYGKGLEGLYSGAGNDYLRDQTKTSPRTTIWETLSSARARAKETALSTPSNT